jgi:hypothetical protein
MEADLQFFPVDKTVNAMRNFRIQLMNLATENKKRVERGGIAASADKKEYSFGLGFNGSDELGINFTDFPGGWLTDDVKSAEIYEAGSQSDVIFVPIDTPPLMEHDGEYHDYFNDPEHIRCAFNEIRRRDPDRKRLIVLAPIRCESYVETETNAETLNHKIHTAYGGLISFLSSGNNALVITPIQTVGGLRFSRFEETGEQDPPVDPVFVKKDRRSTYDPKDCDQPMRYLLRFMLRRHEESRYKGPLEIFLPWFFSDRRWVNAKDKIVAGCKNGSGGFEIVHGEHLL